jgi:hypothetical protein
MADSCDVSTHGRRDRYQCEVVGGRVKSCRRMMVVQWLGLATIEQAHAQSTSEITAPNKRA